MNNINEMVISKDERIRKAIIDIIKSQKEQQCHIDSAIYDEYDTRVECENQIEKIINQFLDERDL